MTGCHTHCCKEKLLCGITDSYGKDANKMKIEISNKTHGGRHTYLNYCTIRKLLMTCKDTVIDENLNQSSCRTECNDSSLKENDTINVYVDIESLMSKELLTPCVS